MLPLLTLGHTAERPSESQFWSFRTWPTSPSTRCDPVIAVSCPVRPEVPADALCVFWKAGSMPLFVSFNLWLHSKPLMSASPGRLSRQG